MRIIASHNIIILPKNWCFCNSFTANQPRFQIQFSKNYPRRNLKNNVENVVGLYRWQRQRAEPLQTSFSNSVRASFRICSHIKRPEPASGLFMLFGRVIIERGSAHVSASERRSDEGSGRGKRYPSIPAKLVLTILTKPRPLSWFGFMLRRVWLRSI